MGAIYLLATLAFLGIYIFISSIFLYRTVRVFAKQNIEKYTYEKCKALVAMIFLIEFVIFSGIVYFSLPSYFSELRTLGDKLLAIKRIYIHKQWYLYGLHYLLLSPVMIKREFKQNFMLSFLETLIYSSLTILVMLVFLIMAPST